MSKKLVIALIVLGIAYAAKMVFLSPVEHPARGDRSPSSTAISPLVADPGATREPHNSSIDHRKVSQTNAVAEAWENGISAANKVERLAQIRETFHRLASGEAKKALQAAKQLKDETARETALLELVTVWRGGELENPQIRARRIAEYGVEAGLGLELAKDPETALAWADELTDGAGRTALVQQVAIAMVDKDPAAAFALSERLSADERSGFLDSLYAGWAQKDTEAALQWADQLSDSEREGALRSIRSVAPVGIGTEMAVQDGYAVIRGLVPGMPAELSGQIQPGDRILGVAQGDNAFVDTRGVSLQELVQMIRGAPGTAVQLRLLAADASADAVPRTVSMVRGQIKYKQ
jgi:hypothetical protein